MTARDLGAVLLKCLGILLLVQAALGLPQSFEGGVYALAADRPAGAVVVLAAFVVRVGLGLWLLRSSESLASRLAPASSPTATAIDPFAVRAALIGVLGLYFVGLAIPELIGHAYYFHFLSELGSMPSKWGAEPSPVAWGVVVPSIARLLIGVLIFFFAERLARVASPGSLSRSESGAAP